MEARITTLDELSKLADDFLMARPKGAVVGLTGDLGAGKTTFVRLFVEAVARRMNVKSPKVTSPSFVLHQSYPKLVPPVDHFDLYRLEKAARQDLVELGYFEIVETNREKNGFVFIEWPERESEPELLGIETWVTIEMKDTFRTVRIR